MRYFQIQHYANFWFEELKCEFKINQNTKKVKLQFQLQWQEEITEVQKKVKHLHLADQWTV